MRSLCELASVPCPLVVPRSGTISFAEFLDAARELVDEENEVRADEDGLGEVAVPKRRSLLFRGNLRTVV